MSRLRHNILANYAGQAWMILMGLAFVPLYVRVLGIEAFGLISFMLSLQALSQLFDLGTGGAINRELARRKDLPDSGQASRDLTRSFELLIWPTAAAIALALWLASPLIAGRWLQPDQLSLAETTQAIALMAIAVAAFWSTAFYSSALSGLEQQVGLNLANVLFATLRSVGVIPVILHVSATASAYIAWHALVGMLHTACLMGMLWRKLPLGSRPAAFQWSALRSTWRFAGGLFAISVLSLGLSHLDRVALSTLRPLEELGYYGLAISATAGLGRLVLPMFNALYPRFSRLVASGQLDQVVSLYHQSSQLLAVVVASAAAVVVLFAHDILYLWTGDHQLASRAATPLAILAVGTAINGVLNVPYALQLAHGWTRLTIAANSLLLLLAIPYCAWAIPQHGIYGAAGLWLAVNLCLLIFALPIMHRRLLRGELSNWYFRDLLPPTLIAIIVASAIRAIMPELSRTPTGAGMLIVACMLTFFASAMVSPEMRRLAFKRLA